MSKSQSPVDIVDAGGLFDWVTILGLVFGGCCSNVFALEAVLKSHPSAGIFLTFVQFLYVTCQTLSTQLIWNHGSTSASGWLPRVKKTVVPVRRWMIQVLLFLAVSILNNYAFGLKVPVPVHIIFRSGGLCVSMIIGWVFGKKRYTGVQVISVVMVTLGIILATVSAPPKPKGRPPTIQSAPSSSYLSDHLQYALGIAVLSLALVISAFMGLFQEKTYGTYGRGGAVWQESIFYSHALSLPFFLPFLSNLSTDFAVISSSPPAILSIPSPLALLPNKYPGTPTSNVLAIKLPSAWIALGMNVFTQGLCINGVNRLTSKVSSVSVNLILTLRKAVSLAISVWYYGSGFNKGLVLGASMVLAGSTLYSMAPGPGAYKDPKKVEVPSKREAIVSGSSTSAASSVNLKKRPQSRFEELN